MNQNNSNTDTNNARLDHLMDHLLINIKKNISSPELVRRRISSGSEIQFTWDLLEAVSL